MAMAAPYVSVAQTEHETPYEDANRPDSQSPTLPDHIHRPLSLDFERLAGNVSVIDPTTNSASNGTPKVNTILKSFSSTQSYDLVEDDDYEEQSTPRKANFGFAKTPAQPEQPPARTASVSRHLPLSHPTPDLQSLQGAYVKNVERLEESAERLSVTSSIGEEIERMKSEQRDMERRSSGASSHASRRGVPRRDYSTSSFSNSIIGVNTAARSGGYSPSGYITSPTGSIRSSSWAPKAPHERQMSRGSRLGLQLSEHEFEERPLEYEPDSVRPMAANVALGKGGALVVTNEKSMDQRPGSSGSNDTFQQKDDPFKDFDGVHHGRPSAERSSGSLRRISLNHPPLARDSRMFKEEQPGEKMIYYPAPVPVMLNLPTRLSKANFGDIHKHRLQALSNVPEVTRQSAAWLSTENLASDPGQSPPQQRVSNLRLPPQLRASAFFDQPSQAANLELKNGSAVQTLDSILDAAAHAPVSAFTDHPIAGRVSRDFYKPEVSSRKSTQIDPEVKKKRRSSLSSILKRGKSSDDLRENRQSRITSRESKIFSPDGATPIDELDEAAISIAPGEDEAIDEEIDQHDHLNDAEESVHEPGFSQAPTTLLAELQYRKAQLKGRTRTAADAFPNGMHSTLLELDAVTQIQQKARKQNHVILAWEDHEAADRQNFDDDDVPLGVLFPEKDRYKQANTHRVIGLMEKRDMEDNEPLSHRRARLRGEEIRPPPSHATQSHVGDAEAEASKYRLELPGATTSPPPEDEDETLAQRVKRMKAEKERATAGSFANDLTSELGLPTEGQTAAPKPEVEETLGQRKQRLREEAQQAGLSTSSNAARPGLQPRRSMADILQAHPVGHRQVSNESGRSFTQLPQLNAGGYPNAAGNRGSVMPHLPPHMQTYYNHQPYVQPTFGASQGMFGMPQMNAYGVQNGYAPPVGGQQYPFHASGLNIGDPDGPPMTREQRGMIDRWRMGIAQE